MGFAEAAFSGVGAAIVLSFGLMVTNTGTALVSRDGEGIIQKAATYAGNRVGL
tara:strand:+ start:6417 stop:6575 length:159 start_codon:yes stop_codon:yes gene_type:complete